MKKILKTGKNFQKGYLQTAFYVVNYGKITMGKGRIAQNARHSP